MGYTLKTPVSDISFSKPLAENAKIKAHMSLKRVQKQLQILGRRICDRNQDWTLANWQASRLIIEL